ncbi:MAG TPA: hypothetical protein RMH99_13320 [Sandaracinaceae bacterium LLY-WYZ-13_1]|nr:hypothetical protein [Sandaracinaceae bacterium LLY-WYZ-13_1]
MRWRLVTMAVLALGCGADDDASAPADEAGERAIEARHGGVIVSLGEHTGELVVHASGELHLHVRSDEALSDAGVTVTLEDEAGEPHAVALSWADGVQGFVGRMEQTPAPGDASVLLVHDGRRRRGEVRVERVLPRAEHEGSVLAVGDRVVEVLVEPDGRAHLYLLGAPRRLDVELTLSVAGEDGRLHPLSLAWDDEGEHYTGRLEGLEPQPGPLEVILERRGRESLGRGTLLEVGLPRPAVLGDGTPVPDDFRLEMPSLGSGVPAVIPVPPPEDGDE